MGVKLDYKIQRLKRYFIAGVACLSSACLFHSSPAVAGQNLPENPKTAWIAGQCSTALSELIAQFGGRITLGQWAKHCNVSNDFTKSMNYLEAILGAQTVVSSPQAISRPRKVKLAGGPVNASRVIEVNMHKASGSSSSLGLGFVLRFTTVRRSGT